MIGIEANTAIAEAETGNDNAGLVRRILAGEDGAFAQLMRRHNQRLFRTARSIVGNPTDAEDVVQEAYLKAYRSLSRFEGRSSLSTWLVRITVNEALTRVERARRVVSLHSQTRERDEVPDDAAVRATGWLGDNRRGPEQAAGDRELGAALSRAIDALPEPLRVVFVLRGVEAMSVEETADCLGLSPQAVRVRLHRARSALRGEIDQTLTEESRQLFSFGSEHCDRLVGRVLTRVLELPWHALGLEPASRRGWADVPKML